MKSKVNWFAKRFGKKLLLLHRWHAWMFLFLALSGILLSIGSIRGDLGAGRVWLKQLHIWIGVGSLAILILYSPLLSKHWKTLRKKTTQRYNLSIVLFLVTGWIISGFIMSFYKFFPGSLTNLATTLHGMFSWIGIPYAVYHSITRLKWAKQKEIQPPVKEDSKSNKTFPPAITGKALFNRRKFIRITVGAGVTAIVFSLAGQKIGNLLGFSIKEREPNSMVPQPDPLPESAAVIGGGSEGRFRVYTVTDIPSFTEESFQFKIDGLVNKPVTLNWEQFLRLKREVQVSDFHCVTGWSVFNNTWEGIKLSDLLDQSEINSSATHVKFYSGDKVYTDSLTIEQARLDSIMIAVLHDGKPIPQDLGGPIRLIIPEMYAYKSVKWLERIELIDYQHVGYWQERGYDIDAWV